VSRWILALGVVVALFCGAASLAAQGFSQVGFATFATDVALVTTAETVIVSSGPVTAPRQSVNVCVFAWAQLTTGTGTTSVTPRIRRGTAAAGTLVGEANAQEVLAAAGTTEKYFMLECEDRSNVATVDYSLTLTQAGASANGAALHGGILVFVR
jgi:hypothetical protein